MRKIFYLLLIISIITSLWAEGDIRNPEIAQIHEELRKENLTDSMHYEYLHRLELLYRGIDVDSSTVFAFQALKYAERTNDYQQLIRSSLSIAQIYKEFREVYRALEYETNALKLAEAHDDSTWMFSSYHALIITHIWYSKEYDIAKIYLKKGLKLAEAMKSPRNESIIHYYFGILFVNLGEYELSEKYYIKALQYNRETANKRGIANCLNNLGDLKEKQGKLDEALDYNRQSLEINKALGDSSGLFINTFNMASIYGKMGKDEKFFNIMDDQKEKAIKNSDLSKLQMIYELLYQFYENKKDFENGLIYFKKMVETNDEMAKNTKSIQVRRIENKHLLEKVSDQQKIYELELKNKNTTLYFISALLFLSLVLFISMFIYFIKTKKMEELEIKELKTKAELMALQYKINPHFLFNSLNSISQLIIKKSENAEIMIQNLSDLLRYTLTFANKDFVSLEDELEAVRQYLAMEQIRFQDRLIFHIDCEKQLKKEFIPPMIILPLVENSIKHGISKLIEDGEIHVKVYEKDNYLNIRVKDNGPESDETFPVNSKNSTGFGHQSIIDRLKITYQGNHKFEISNNDDIYCVKISIPLNE